MLFNLARARPKINVPLIRFMSLLRRTRGKPSKMFVFCRMLVDSNSFPFHRSHIFDNTMCLANAARSWVPGGEGRHVPPPPGVYYRLVRNTVGALIQKPFRSGQGPCASVGLRGFWPFSLGFRPGCLALPALF